MNIMQPIIYEIFKDTRRKIMKFKKIAALSTAVIMSASMLVGCGNNKSKENTDKSFKIGMVAISVV